MIYALFSCNAWKEWASMQPIIFTKSLHKLKKQLLIEIKNKNMSWRGSVDIKDMEEELKNPDIYSINTMLEFGNIIESKDGEVL